MAGIQNVIGTSQEANMVNEAVAKLAIRVENLEKGSVSEGVQMNGDGSQDFGPVLIKTLARLREIHASVVSGASAAEETLKKLKAAEETIAKQAYQIKHLKRSLEAEEACVSKLY